MSSNGQARIGIRSAITNSPIIPTTTISASLLQSLYGAWNGDTTTNELATSLYGVWNGEYSGTASLETSLYGAWNGEALGTSLDTSIYRVYNGDNLNDTSGNSQNGTNVGGVTFTTGKIGNTFTFNGSNYVTLPNDSMNLTGDFSISTWVNFATLSGTKDILSSFTLLGGNYYGFELYANGPGLKFSTFNGTTTYLLNDLLSTGSPLSANTWYNIVITRKSSTGTKMYINGTLNVSNTSTQNPVYAPTNYATIGASNAGSYVNLAASGTKIDGLTIWNKELTVSEIVSLYNAGNGAEYPFSSQTLPTPNDSFGTNHGTLMNGTTFTTGKIGKAFTFDGVNDYVQLQNNSLNFPSTSFSVSFWVNLANITSGNYALVSNYANDGVNRGWIVGSLTSGKLYFGIYAPSIQETVTSATIAINTWYHVTCVYTPNQPTKTYINGTLDSTSSTSYNPSYVTTHYPSIGASKYNSLDVQQYVSNGTKIDALNIWNKALTSNEVSMLYNGSNGTQYSSGSFGLTQSSLDSFGTYHGTLVNTTYGTGKFGSAFNFTGGNINMGTGAANFGTNPFTISLWFYPNAGNNLQVLVAKGFTGGTDKGFYLNTDNRYNSNLNGIAFGLNTGGTYRTIVTTSTFPYTAAAWNHLVVTRSGNTTLIYLNGVLTSTTNAQVGGTTDVSGDISNTGANMLLAQYGSGGLNFAGRMDGLTMWSRVVSVDEVTQLYNSGTGAQYPFTGTFSSAINQLGVDNGTLMNGCYLSDGKIGKAFTFDGINDFVLLPTNSMRFTGDFSYSFFVSLGSISGDQTILSCENYLSNENGDRGYLIFFSNGVLKFNGYYNSSVIFTSLSTTTITTNTWYHFVVTKTASQVKIYMNGFLQTTTNFTGTLAYNSVVYPAIGVQYKQNNVNNNNYSYISGGSKIDALNAWSKDLTQAEITELYNSGNGKQLTTTPIVTSGLVLNLDASRTSSYTGTGTNAYDSSYSNYSFSLTNGAGYTASNGGAFTFIQNNNTYLDRNGGGINVGNKFTVQLWAKISKFGGNEGGTWKRAGFVNNSWNWSSNQGWALLASSQFGSNNVDTPGKEFLTFSLGQDQWGFTTSYGSMTQYLNTWVNITVVVNGTNQLKAYINGVEPTYLYVQNGPGDGVLNYNLNYFYIGRTNQDNLDGSIGSFYMYNRPLSQTEIQQNFNVTKSRFGL